MSNLKDLSDKVGFCVEADVYAEALTHKSVGKMNNERLEFLGDSVLYMVTSQYLYAKHGDYDEGTLSKFRMEIISGSNCSRLASIIGLQDHMVIGDAVGMIAPKILEDAFEAFVGALYLDKGIKFADMFICDLIDKHCDYTVDTNYRQKLLEYCNKMKLQNPEYKVFWCKTIFVCQCFVNGLLLSVAESNNKKSAIQLASKKVLNNLNK